MLGGFFADVNAGSYPNREASKAPTEERWLVDKLVINDRRRKAHLALFLLGRVFGPHHAALADDVAVLLSRNLFGHLENHLDQRVNGERLRTNEKDAALADVFDDALIPGAGFVHPIAQLDVQFESASPRYPRRSLLARMAAANAGLGLVLHALGTAHGRPVIFVFRRAQQANLVVV